MHQRSPFRAVIEIKANTKVAGNNGKETMLILTRRIDERIFIGDDIVLSVLDIEGNRVKLGIQAPKEIAILREEVHARYHRKAANESIHSGVADELKSA